MPERDQDVRVDEARRAVAEHVQASKAGGDVGLLLRQSGVEGPSIRHGPREGGKVVGDQTPTEVLKGVDVRVHIPGQDKASARLDHRAMIPAGIEMASVHVGYRAEVSDDPVVDQDRVMAEDAPVRIERENIVRVTK